MTRKFLIANWKANPESQEEAVKTAMAIDKSAQKKSKVVVGIAPPFIFLPSLKKILKNTELGTQNVFWEETGPYTGEISWKQLKKMGVKFSIVGHSERKKIFGETNEIINKKLIALLTHKMSAILCVGEFEKSPDSSKIVGDQLRAALKNIPAKFFSKLMIAYEPVWAISTNPNAVPDTPENVYQMSNFIRRMINTLSENRKLSIDVLYGGSSNPKNLRDFLEKGGVEGALVGGASLDSRKFDHMLEIAEDFS